MSNGQHFKIRSLEELDEDFCLSFAEDVFADVLSASEPAPPPQNYNPPPPPVQKPPQPPVQRPPQPQENYIPQQRPMQRPQQQQNYIPPQQQPMQRPPQQQNYIPPQQQPVQRPPQPQNYIPPQQQPMQRPPQPQMQQPKPPKPLKPDQLQPPKKLTGAQKVLAGCSTGVLIMLAVALAAVLVPMAMHMKMLAVVSGSMAPKIPTGSLVLVKAMPYEDIRVGDVVTYQTEANKMVTHQVVEKIPSEERLITQGLQNASTDSPVSYVNVVGVVRWHVRFIGYALAWLEPTSHKIITGVVVVAIWAIVFIVASGFSADPKDDDKRKRNKQQEAI